MSVTTGLPSVSVPVLSKATSGDLARALSSTAPPFMQQAAPRAGREPGGDGGRRRDDQRAGAADQQEREALVDPLVPGPAEEQRRDDGDQRADDEHGRRVVPREAVDEALGRRLALLRLLDQPDDAGDGVVGGGRGHPHAQHARRR